MQDSTAELIASIITPPGEGGVGAIRVAGTGARNFCAQFLGWSDSASNPQSFHLQYTNFKNPNTQEALDEVMAVWMPAGKSYTGDEQVEIFCHGGQMTLSKILESLFSAGARAAAPGEFTKRAFLSGRIDLSQAEAVAEIISAKSDFAYRAARDNLFGRTGAEVTKLRDDIVQLGALLEANVDFPEEEIDPGEFEEMLRVCNSARLTLNRLVESYTGGAVIRDGFKIALAGRPNAGKSTLFNALLKTHRAIVSSTPGTTRDYISEWIQLGQFAVQLTDTAGLRDQASEIESQGQKFAQTLIKEADLTLWIIDVSEPNWRGSLVESLPPGTGELLWVANKVDLLDKSEIREIKNEFPLVDERKIVITLSCKTGQGLAELEHSLNAEIKNLLPDQTDGYFVTSERHRQKFADALLSLDIVERGLNDQLSPELIAFDLKGALTALDEITGAIYTEDMLERIFATFCIGK